MAGVEGNEAQIRPDPGESDEGTIADSLMNDGPGRSMQIRRIDSIMRIPVVVQVVVGSATLPVSSLLKLGRGAVIPLDHRVGDPVDIVVNSRIIARGEVVVVEEDGARFGVSLTEICDPQGERST
jgi:flagellar motor switch protein FliN/FliY